MRLRLLLEIAFGISLLGAIAAPAALANDPPICQDMEHSVASGAELHLQGSCADADGPSPLSYSLVTGPSHGTLSGSPSGAATYRSYVGYTGDDSFQYRAHDGATYSNTATVTIHVGPPPAGNQPPQCPESVAFVASGGSVDLFGNCADADGDSISYLLTTPPTGGSLTILGPSSVRYAPNPGTTSDSFGYSASDPFHAPVSVTVPITVVPPGTTTFNSAPEATESEPVVASITTTQSGGVTIDARAVTATPPTGFFLLNQEFDITAPAAAGASNPLQLVFTIDALQVPAGAVTVFRDGVPVGPCTGAPGEAAPDPCVAASTTDANGDLKITVLSTHASVWNFGVSAGPSYDFQGFMRPVDNPPFLNALKAGQAVPVKFSLGGDQGLDVFASGYPKSQAIPCDSDSVLDGVEQTVSASASGVTYDAATDTYTYVWKTDRAWTLCRQLVLKLADGSTQVANFSFK